MAKVRREQGEKPRSMTPAESPAAANGAANGTANGSGASAAAAGGAAEAPVGKKVWGFYTPDDGKFWPKDPSELDGGAASVKVKTVAAKGTSGAWHLNSCCRRVCSETHPRLIAGLHVVEQQM